MTPSTDTAKEQAMIVEVFAAIVVAIAEAIAIVITILIKAAVYAVIGIFKIFTGGSNR